MLQIGWSRTELLFAVSQKSKISSLCVYVYARKVFSYARAYKLLVVKICHLYIVCFTQMCTDTKLSDKTLFSTFVRTIPPISRLAPPVHALMEPFNWTRVGMITQNSQQWSQWNALVSFLREEGVTVSTIQTMAFGVHYNESGLSSDFEQLLQGAAYDSRGKLT